MIEIFYRFTCAKTLVKRVVCGLKKPSDDSCSGDETMHGNGCSYDFEISRSDSVKKKNIYLVIITLMIIKI